MIDVYGEFAALVRAFDAAKIDYALCGALALAVHGAARATKDIDVLAKREDEARIGALAKASGFVFTALPMEFWGHRPILDRRRDPLLSAAMSLAVYGHPFSSYTQKVLTALYETGTPFELCSIENPDHAQQWMQRWPMRKFPLLVDGDRTVIETSVIIEYLQLAHPGAAKLLPPEPMAALDVRFLDRFFDLHVMDAAQFAVDGAITKDDHLRAAGLTKSVKKLDLAYAWLDGHLAGKAWANGAEFSMADCAAAPSLFYADWVHPIDEKLANLRAYRARLLARPSFARCVEEGRPFRSYFPLGAPDRD